ncbi:MAG: choice-of-anchor D domain-containing protein [Candidatus Binataceae bacterium]
MTLKITPKSVNFGKVKIGATSRLKTITISNPKTKKASKKNSGIAYPVIVMGETPSPNPFKLQNGCQATLAPKQNCKVTLQFVPTTTGKQSGELVIDDNANGSPQTVKLRGNGAD